LVGRDHRSRRTEQTRQHLPPKQSCSVFAKLHAVSSSRRPVTFHYKSHTTAAPQFGLVAEDVAKVNPGLVVRDDRGEICTVRYDAVNAMLLNEFLKKHRRVMELKKEIADLATMVKQQGRKSKR
jgi:hypothetical protein